MPDFTSKLHLLRSQVGCLMNELPPTWRAVRKGKGEWRGLHNRHERLEIRADAEGIYGARCEWEHSSELTVARVFPKIANRLCRVSFRSIDFRWSMPVAPIKPAVSVLIAIGGSERIRLLQPCLASLAAAAHHIIGGAEIVLIQEKDGTGASVSEIAGVRTVWVEPQPLFNKSLMLNRGAEAAHGRYLVIHDGDLIVAPTYLETCRRMGERCAGGRPARLIFYCNQASSERLVEGVNRNTNAETLSEAGVEMDGLCFEQVVQNTPNPMIVRRETYFAIGGNDESFVGWGGEDLEFLSRLRTCGTDEFGAEPLIHLWHAPSPKKATGDRNQRLQDAKLALPAEQRIADLVKSNSR